MEERSIEVDVMVKDKREILQMRKQKVQEFEPNATVILYGSYARGEEREDSDIDVLILIDIDKEKIKWKEGEHVAYPIVNLGIEAGVAISPVIYSKKGWANHRVTPFYENVNREGIVL